MNDSSSSSRDGPPGGGDPHVYDLGGLVGIMAACLRNLEQHSDEIELDEWEDRFSAEELKTLFALATRLQTTSGTHERE